MAKKTAEAEETGTLIVSGSDQDDGALNYDEGFDEAIGAKKKEAPVEPEAKPIPPRKAGSEKETKLEDKPEEKTDDKKESEVKTEDQKPLTAAERAEAEVKKLDEKSGVSPKPEESAGDVLDSLPPEYSWAKSARDSGKIAAFLEKQPKAVQKIAQSGEQDDVLYVLDLYHKSLQPAVTPTPTEMKSFMEEFGDLKFKAPDGTQKTLKEISTEYENEELFEAFVAMNRKMLEKNSGVPNQSSVDELQSRIDQLKFEQEQARIDQAFWEAIQEVHADGKKLFKSGKVKEWVDTKASNAIKRLYKEPGADHAIIVIDAYKEAMALEAKDTANETAANKKKQIDGLHGESLRPKRENKVLDSKADDDKPEAFDQGFDEATKGK